MAPLVFGVLHPVNMGRSDVAIRRVRSLRGIWRLQLTPELKKRTALLAKGRDIFRRHRSQHVQRVIELINAILRGWVNYFTVGHSSRCFSYVLDCVYKKVRRHFDACPKTQWLRLAEVESAMGVRDYGAV